MKLFLKIVIGLLFLYQVTNAQVNVVVNLPPVMPSELNQWRDNPALVSVVFSNPGAPINNLRIGYKIRDLSRSSNIITTKDDMLPAHMFNTGANFFTGHSIFSFPTVEINQEFYNTAATTNSLPEGQYEFCLYVLDGAGTVMVLTGSQCAYFQVIIPQAISLMQPVNNITYQQPVNSTYPMFLWTPAFTQGVPVTYRLRIVPVFQGQTHYDAINTNPTLVNRDLTGTNYQYSPSDPSFELYPTATKFAWQVRATNQFGNPVTANDGRSDVFCFAFNNNQPGALAVSGEVSGCEVNTGRIVLTVTGGTAPYTYAWKNNNTPMAANTATASNLANGNYSVLVTDNEGDTASARFRVTITPVSFYPNSTNSTCGGSTGSVGVGTLSGGTGPYRYELKRTAPDTASWRGTATAQSTLRTGLRSGSYTLTITDNKGCSTTRNVTISDSNNPPTAYVDGSSILCPGTGKIFFRSSLSSPYRVLKFDFRGPNNFSRTVIGTRDSLLNLDSGIYTYTATDTITRCVKSGQVVVSMINFNTIVAQKTVTNATQGTDDGEFYIKLRRNPISITLSHQDGTNFSENVNPLPEETTATLFVYNATGLKGGNYTMRLYYGANNTCEKTVTFNVASCDSNFKAVPDSTAYYYRTQTMVLSLNSVPNGSYTLKIVRSNGQVKYGPVTLTSTGQASVTRNIPIRTSNYAEGGYTIIVTHSGGCVATKQFIIYRNPPCEAGRWTAINIAPVQQRTQMWCWLTCGEMIFRHFNIAAPQNMTYQCHIISFYYPACRNNCGACVVGANSAANLRNMITTYSKYRWNNAAQINTSYVQRAMTIAEIKAEIDASRPIITGISTSGVMRPVSEHVAVLIGYADGTLTGSGAACFKVRINDPYPYRRGANPYIAAGGTQIANLQYEIEYDSFRTKLAWGESFYNFTRQALN